MLKKYVTLIVFVLFVFYSNDVEAHRCGGRPHTHGGGGGPTPCPPPPVPIDGGVGLLLVLGIGYAVGKLKNKE